MYLKVHCKFYRTDFLSFGGDNSCSSGISGVAIAVLAHSVVFAVVDLMGLSSLVAGSVS